MNIDALNGAVLHVVARPIIKGVDIDVIAVNGQRRQILLSERIGIPQRFKRRCRNGLQVTAGKRNQDNTLRDNRAARAVHRRAKLERSHDGARCGIDLVQDGIPCLSAPYRGARDKVYLSVRDNGVRRRTLAPAFCCSSVRRLSAPRRRVRLCCRRKGIRCRAGAAIRKAVPRDINIGMSGSRISF